MGSFVLTHEPKKDSENEKMQKGWKNEMREMKRNRHKGKGGGIVKGILSFAMALAMVSGTLPGTPFVMTARAESAASEKTITGLGTGAITNPVQPANTTDVPTTSSNPIIFLFIVVFFYS